MKQRLCHDMRAVGKQGKDRNSCLGNSRKAYHATKAVIQHLIVSQQSTFSSPLALQIRLSVNSQVSCELQENSP